MPEFRVASCSHGADVCDGCHREFVRATRTFNTDADTGNVQIACMTRGCTGGYTTDALFRLFPDRVARDALFERLSNARFERMSNAVYCSRPQCATLLTFETDPGAVCTSIVCGRCANAMCLACKRDAHDGVSCADYEESTAASGWTSEKLVNAISRRCPRCLFRIFRQGGCPHMTCSQCAYQFCYGCLGDRSTYRAGAHEGCERIASQFELEGTRVLAQVRRDEKTARRKAELDAQFAVRAERRAARALAGEANYDSDDEEHAGFDAFAVFASLPEEQVAPVADAAAFDAFAVFASLDGEAQQSVAVTPVVVAAAVVDEEAAPVFDAFAEFARLTEEEPVAVLEQQPVAAPFDAFSLLHTHVRAAMSLVRSMIWSETVAQPEELFAHEQAQQPRRRPLSMSA